jgi:molybdopterin converting factor small subunit
MEMTVLMDPAGGCLVRPAFMLSFARVRSPIRATQIMHVEFFGVPRERAGMSELEVQAHTLGQLLSALTERIPSFGKFVGTDRLHPAFVANLNGDRFVSDPGTPLGKDDCVLILSADAGG